MDMDLDMEYKDFIIHKIGQVAVVTLNRPKKGNSWTKDTYLEMESIQDQLHFDDDVKVIVFRGAGEKYFCSGVDLQILAALNSYFISMVAPKFQDINTRWERHSKPVIMAINGLAVGSGLELALAGDIRISVDTARMSINEVKLGLNPDMGGTQRLTRVVGASQSKRLIFTGDLIDSQEALRIGLVDMVFDKENFMEEVLKLANKIGANPPLAVRFAKKAINLAVETNLTTGLLYESMASTFCVETEDMKEAVNAVIEKRLPIFKGK